MQWVLAECQLTVIAPHCAAWFFFFFFPNVSAVSRASCQQVMSGSVDVWLCLIPAGFLSFCFVQDKAAFVSTHAATHANSCSSLLNGLLTQCQCWAFQGPWLKTCVFFYVLLTFNLYCEQTQHTTPPLLVSAHTSSTRNVVQDLSFFPFS